VRWRSSASLRLFEDGRISARPEPDGYYVAESRLFPLALLSLDLRDGVAETQKAQLLSEPGRLSKLDVSSSSGGCAGAIRGLEHVVFTAFSLPLVA